jgi:acyl-CoA ligase (AMP-forming) (exosortase A-associated)
MRIQLHNLVDEAAGTHGDAPAVTYKETTVTYAELWQGIACFGTALKGLGMCRGDRAAVYLDKQIETVIALFGISAGDAVLVPINPLLRPKQVAYIIRDCTARILVTSPERLALMREGLQECQSLEHVVLVGPDPFAEPGGRYTVVAWPTATEGDVFLPNAIDVDMAAILYTSGSTGPPKGVVLSHRNLIAGAESVSHYLGNSPDDVILAALPFSFDAGFSQLTTTFSVGAHVVLMNYALPAEVVRLCARHRITGLTGVPPLWIQIAHQDWPDEAARHLRYFANTGGRIPKVTLDRLRSLFPGALPFLMYGLTEAFRSTYLDPEEVDRYPSSIGKAIPNAEILVVRPDGSVCDPGEEGELVHRGALVAMGYWNDPERTAQHFRPVPGHEPGLCTDEIAVWSGDTVVRDEDGYLYFVGRNDDMIKTSGYRVSPTEIEEAAYDTGLVRDAVAFGVEDARLGQHVALFVSPASGTTVDADSLLARMRQALPLYMLPQRVEIKQEISRSPNGKFDRALLREELTA